MAKLYPNCSPNARGVLNSAISGLIESLGISGFEKCMFFLECRVVCGNI